MEELYYIRLGKKKLSIPDTFEICYEQKNGEDIRKAHLIEKTTGIEHSYCYKCGRILPLDCFSADNLRWDGKRCTCKDCTAAADKRCDHGYKVLKDSLGRVGKVEKKTFLCSIYNKDTPDFVYAIYRVQSLNKEEAIHDATVRFVKEEHEFAVNHRSEWDVKGFDIEEAF